MLPKLLTFKYVPYIIKSFRKYVPYERNIKRN